MESPAIAIFRMIVAEGRSLIRQRDSIEEQAYAALAGNSDYQFRGRTKLSKFGNARLRRRFWVAVQVAIRQPNNSFRAKYERYIARNRDNAKLKRKALTAITAKMARTAHAVIETGSDYRPFIGGPVPSGRTSLSKCREGASATLR